MPQHKRVDQVHDPREKRCVYVSVFDGPVDRSTKNGGTTQTLASVYVTHSERAVEVDAAAIKQLRDSFTDILIEAGVEQVPTAVEIPVKIVVDEISSFSHIAWARQRVCGAVRLRVRNVLVAGMDLLDTAIKALEDAEA